MNSSPGDEQIPLSLRLPDQPGFDQYVIGENSEALQSLRSVCKGSKQSCIFLWGPAGCGISHLLQATCTLADNLGLKVYYLPLQVNTELQPAILENIESMDIICIDDLDLICGKQEWEQSIFHLYNKLRESGKNIIMGSHQSARNIPLQLEDLKSRLSWDLVFHINLLGDPDKIEVLKRRADLRGFRLSHDVAEYVVKHASRDLKNLIKILDDLENASLVQQKKLTIPFVKSVIF